MKNLLLQVTVGFIFIALASFVAFLMIQWRIAALEEQMIPITPELMLSGDHDQEEIATIIYENNEATMTLRRYQRYRNRTAAAACAFAFGGVCSGIEMTKRYIAQKKERK